jgi:hypothetical protein
VGGSNIRVNPVAGEAATGRAGMLDAPPGRVIELALDRDAIVVPSQQDDVVDVGVERSVVFRPSRCR